MNLLKYLFYLIIVKPFVFVVLGVNVRNAQNLPKQGPAILIANHNSHIDTLILMSLFPIEMINKVNPVAAADYFFNTKFKRFLFKKLIGAIALKRYHKKFSREDILDEVNQNLKNGHIIILYPEGTRGNDNEIQEFKNGIAHIAKANPDVPIIPVYINGPDKILPKYDNIIVPFISDIYIGEKMFYDNSATKEFTSVLHDKVIELKAQHELRKEKI